MLRRFLLASGKGGVGKSTTAVCLAHAFASRGKSVLLVDCDAGLRALDLLTGLGAQAVYSWNDVLTGACLCTEAIVRDSARPIALLPAPSRADVLPEPTAFSAMLQAADADFDVCILDAGAGIGEALLAYAAAAELAVLMAAPDAVSARGAAAAADFLRDALPQLPLRLVLNRYIRGGACLSPDAMVDLSGVQLLGALPEDMHLLRLSEGEKPERYVTEGAARIAARLLGESVPFREKRLKSVFF